jgi:hypothetical protein
MSQQVKQLSQTRQLRMVGPGYKLRYRCMWGCGVCVCVHARARMRSRAGAPEV